MENTSTLTFESLPENIKKAAAPSLATQATPKPVGLGLGEGSLNYDSFKEQSEKDFIISALKANNGRINQTVAHANIPKNTLLRKIKKYGIQPKDYGQD